MNFLLHPEAEAELFGAIEWYEAQEPGLGRAFAVEVAAGLLRIVEFPEAWPILDGDIHRCLLNRFPFGLLYSIDQDTAIILAVMHLHREPGYWRSRQP
ncbi:MAG: type II toxin-antitoxin system RelE/ParE family toxin [Candidatus Hydrogenedentes bacterium]|nr:type II toxin-antitoxin system RelE/ParE family toxin [Candidatus Hydrogenedentota bacterium]